jgi:membrane-associated protease RseP (regulator of RpoE activity)
VSDPEKDEPYGWTLPPVAPPPERLKFQHRYGRHILLFVATLITTTYAQALFIFAMAASNGVLLPAALFGWATIKSGLWYSIPLLTILAAHEFGHYGYCRRYNVDATLPYFLPAPFLLTGTFGAVIRIRERFPSKSALFDIGVAGPIAGFIALVPFLLWGLTKSSLQPIEPGSLWFGEPLLFKLMARLVFGVFPPGLEVAAHPMAMAAWWGMLATSLNLLPFGQLDGGHIVYSIFGRRAAIVSIATLTATMLLTLRSLSWISMTIMMLVMAFFLGFRHPRIADEDTPLDPTRKMVAVCALLIFMLCFTPVPIETFIGSGK